MGGIQYVHCVAGMAPSTDTFPFDAAGGQVNAPCSFPWQRRFDNAELKSGYRRYRHRPLTESHGIASVATAD